jgi:NAD(P)-dependent dehydrogenase (short-subunit alcohol dehydrogenase family)
MKDLFSLDGKIVAVTGGTGYLGSEISRGLLGYGATVADISVPGSTPAFLSEYSRFISFPCDLSDSEMHRKTFEEIGNRFGHLDALISCAAYGGGSGGIKKDLLPPTLEDITDELWNIGIDGTLGVTFRSLRSAIPLMKKHGGSIVNIASMYGVVSPDPGIYGESGANSPPTYGAGKGGVIQLTRYAAAHLAKFDIRVNSVTPGPFPNPPTQARTDFAAKLASKTMLGRFGQPKEIVGAILLLVSDASSFMTGSNITVDGGWTAW